jgi:hypothetical protein
MIQPSLFEGWSTVAEDAKAIGKSILISDFPVHCEQATPDFHFFNRNNAKELADLMLMASSKFSPGPDLEREKIAREMTHTQIINNGRRFVEIVEKTLQHSLGA